MELTHRPIFFLLTTVYCLLSTALSSRHDQLRRRQDRLHPSVLPTAAGAAHTALAGRPLLRPRAADVDDLFRVGRALARRPVGAVRGLGLRRRAPAAVPLRTARRVRCRKRREPRRPALYDKRRGRRPQQSAEQKARPEERARHQYGPDQTPAPEAPYARGAEAPARPHAPASAHDALAALAAKVRPVQGLRIPFTLEDAAVGGGVVAGDTQEGAWRRSPVSRVADAFGRRGLYARSHPWEKIFEATPDSRKGIHHRDTETQLQA